MCYQLDAPAASLPPKLFRLLDPWLKEASELQILGGEPFMAKQCLDWIRRITPVDYPKLRLAAITNGLFFTPNICALISQRQWNWIHVSIDAATASAYRKVRGGNFAVLLRGLDRLAEVRELATPRFELRLGFTLQHSNLRETAEFLDLCAEYRAVPQFTVVFGNWHDEGPNTAERIRSFYAAIERVDKRLWQRGFGRELISAPLAALSRTAAHLECWRSATPKWVPEVFASDGELDADTNVRLSAPIDGFATLPTPTGRFTVQVPFFIEDKPLSAFSVHEAVSSLLKRAHVQGAVHVMRPIDLRELGLDESNGVLDFKYLHDSERVMTPRLSVVSAVYNGAQYLPYFLDSLLSREQGMTEAFEVIIVDDGSPDGSGELACTLVENYFTSTTRVRIVRRKRTVPYEHGLFTFSAGAARQVGVQLAEGERVLFLDPDQIVEPGCLQEHLWYGRQGFDVVIGDRHSGEIDAASAWSSLRSDALTHRSDWWLSFFTGNSSVEIGLLKRVGGFDIRLQYWGLDDTDLAYRLFRAGASVWHTPRARVLDLSPDVSGGGSDPEEREDSYRLHMEVLYRKYLDPGILTAFQFLR
jgi:glycosyltransferase involved in cell wall biosynthesis